MKLRWSNGHSASYEFEAHSETLAIDIVQGLARYWQTIKQETVELHVLSGKYWLNPVVETDVDVTSLGGNGNFWVQERFVARPKKPALAYDAIYRNENKLREGLLASEAYIHQFEIGLLKIEDTLIHPENHGLNNDNKQPGDKNDH